MPSNSVDAIDYWRAYEHWGGVFKTLVKTHQQAREYRLEGNALVHDWYSDLVALFESPSDNDH